MHTYPQPTYNVREAVDMMITLDLPSMELLGQLIEEEKELYCIKDLRYLHFMFKTIRFFKQVENMKFHK